MSASPSATHSASSPFFATLLPCVLAAAIGGGAVIRAQDGTSTFGHARARQLAEAGLLPTAKDVVVRDIFNRHRHDLPRPRAGESVAFDVRFGTRDAVIGRPAVLQLGLTTARTRTPIERPPTDLVLVLDRSGSMADAGKITHLHEGLRRFARALRPDDRVAVVGYDHEILTLRELTPFRDGTDFLRCIAELTPRGYTDLHGGLMRGLSLLGEASERGARPARVLLLTDGIANRGVVEPAEIAAAAQPFLRSGIELSVIGVGRDVQTDLLRRLADEGRGLFHFVADGKDLEKVFTEDAQALIDVVARDARIVVEHDPSLRVARVYGHRHEIAPGRLTIALDTLNLGMTEVAIVEFEPCRPADPRTRLPVRASLSFVPSTTDAACTPVRLEQVASIDLVASATCVEPTDPEVRKNHTLAVLGQAMFDVASACDGSRFEVARHAASTGLATARARYPKTDDADLNAAMSMLTGFGDAITRRLDAHRPNVTSTPFDR